MYFGLNASMPGRADRARLCVVSLDHAQRRHFCGLGCRCPPASPAPPCGWRRKCYTPWITLLWQRHRPKNMISSRNTWVCVPISRHLGLLWSAGGPRPAVGSDPSTRDPHWFCPGWCSICSSWLPPLWDDKRTHAPITVCGVMHQSAARGGTLVKNTVCCASVDPPHTAASIVKSSSLYFYVRILLPWITFQLQGAHCTQQIALCWLHYIFAHRNQRRYLEAWS